MKKTKLPYPVRSRFFDPCREALKQHKDDFFVGREIIIQLSPEGYNREVIATIDPKDSHEFWVDWVGDPKRCSARIRAAAYVLFEYGLYGEFKITHNTGILTIRAVNLMKK